MAKVLVIEDDVETAAEIAACLTAGGFEPEQRFDGRLGPESALWPSRSTPSPSTACCPERDGLEVVRALREAGCECRC